MSRGPLYMMLAGAFFTVMVAAVKVARTELVAFEVVFWRACISVPVTLSLVLAGRTGLAVRNPGALLLRSVLGFGAMTCFFTAAKGVSIADLSLIGKLQPIWVALAAPLVLGATERSGRGLWLVITGGMIGSALLIGPELAVGAHFGLFALAATGFSAAAHLLVRLLGRTDAPATQVFWFQVATLILASAAIALVDGGLPDLPRVGLWAPLAVCGVSAAIGQAFMTRAYALDGAARIAAASYATPVLGVVADVVAFGVWPDVGGWVGGGLVVASGLWLLWSPAPAAGARGAPMSRRWSDQKAR